MQYEKGRPRVYTGQETPMQTFTLRLPFWHARVARNLGNGNMSEGIRLALEAMRHMDNLLPKPRKVKEC